jgi:hypothetical protein
VPKPKVKMMPMDTKCEQDGPTGAWTFATQGFNWAYHEGVRGLNLSLVTKSRHKDMIFAKSLAEAVMWAWGFAQGFNEGSKMGNDKAASEAADASAALASAGAATGD